MVTNNVLKYDINSIKNRLIIFEDNVRECHLNTMLNEYDYIIISNSLELINKYIQDINDCLQSEVKK